MRMSTIKIIGAWLILSLWGAVAYGGTVTYVYTDPQGTPLAEADASGNITARFDYTPYGVAVASMGPAPNGPGYTGQVNDPDTGLVYMLARYYDPAVGRFLSTDPVTPSPGNAFNLNRYDYANNNPVVNMDTDGRETGIAFHAEWLAGGGHVVPTSPDDKVQRPLMYAMVGLAAVTVGPEVVGMVKTAITIDKVLTDSSSATARRPQGVPKSWVADKPSGGPGTIYRNPENLQHDTVRAVPGRPESSQPGQQVDHVIRTANGKRYGEANIPVSTKSQESHIPAEKFHFIPADQLPKN